MVVLFSPGLVTATVASEVYKAAQPALLYLVPFTLLPILVMAYLKVRSILNYFPDRVPLALSLNGKKLPPKHPRYPNKILQDAQRTQQVKPA